MRFTYTTAISTHEISRQSTAVIRRSRTRAIPLASNLPHTARKSRNDLFSTVDSNLLTSPDSRDIRRRVPTEPGPASGAAPHLPGAGTLVCHGAAGAVGCPAAVPRRPVCAVWLGAALDVGGVGGAGSRDGGSAGRGARGIGDAHAGDAVGAVTGLVGGR